MRTFVAHLDAASLLVTPCTNTLFIKCLSQLAMGIPQGPGGCCAHKTYSDFSALSVLVAEDNPVNQMVICGLLKIFELNWWVVENSRAAVDYCRMIIRKRWI